MKNLILFLPLIFLACSKQDVRQPKHFGVVGNVDQDFAKIRKGRGKPVKDTVVVTPPDTTTIPTDTIPTVDPVPVPALPPAYSIGMLTPLNQGGEGSCVGFSVCYTREREHFNKTGVWVPLSEEYLFDAITSDHSNCSGSGIITALEFLKSTGVCTAASLPYSWANGCSVDTSGLGKEAAQFKISGYVQVLSTDSVGIKSALLANHPLVIQVAVDQNFYDAGAGFIWTTLGPTIGYHSLVICGYDDYKRAYKVMNQWGTSWGDGGFSWIGYDLFPKASSNALKMIL